MHVMREWIVMCSPLSLDAEAKAGLPVSAILLPDRRDGVAEKVAWAAG